MSRDLAMLLRLVLICVAAMMGPSEATEWNITCPVNCLCTVTKSQRLQKDLRTVDCSHRMLKTVPVVVPHSTQALILRGNVISDLHDIIPDLLELEELDVSNNKLRNLGRGLIFHNLSSLIYLNLAKNDVNAIFKEVFHGLSNLQYLILSENKVTFIEDQAFQWMSRLRTLDLSSNQLSALYVEWFTGLVHVQEFDVSHNRVHQVNSVVFRPLRNLERLLLHNNLISDVSNDAFVGLDHLQVLHLENNQLRHVPSYSLQSLRGLVIAHLSSNPFSKLLPGDFTNLTAQELHLTHLPSLTVVEAGAFRDLPFLLSLQLHDNPQLTFVDPSAIKNATRLRTVALHNNRLEGLSRLMMDALPVGVEVTLHGNPLRCDCNIRRIRQELNGSRITFTDPAHLQCSSPEKLKGKNVRDLDLKQILKECPPSVLPIVNGTVERRLGDGHIFDCRALGIPPPTLAWVLPGGEIVNQTSNSVRVQVRSSGTLTFFHLKEADSGIYTCIAENKLGRSEGHVKLVVRPMNLELFPISITSTFVDLVWKGAERNAYPHYILMYKQEKDRSGNYKHVVVNPIMRSYTVNNLLPETTYEFCIAFKGKDGLLVQISCIKARTYEASYMQQGIQRTGNIAVAVVLGIFAAMFIVICIATVARKYRHRFYENPDKPLVSTMSQIPLENLYSPLMSNIGS